MHFSVPVSRTSFLIAHACIKTVLDLLPFLALCIAFCKPAIGIRQQQSEDKSGMNQILMRSPIPLSHNSIKVHVSYDSGPYCYSIFILKLTIRERKTKCFTKNGKSHSPDRILSGSMTVIAVA